MGSAKVMETEVLVIGSGAAGLAAAIEARDAGAEVIVFEKQPTEDDSSSSLCGGLISFAGGSYVLDALWSCDG